MAEEDALSRYLDSVQFTKASSNASRLVAKLKAAVQKNELYETHQILRTVYFRFINSKEEERIAALVHLLYHGSDYLLKKGEFVSGQDVAQLLLEASARELQLNLENKGQEARSTRSYMGLSHHVENKTIDLDICQKVATIAVQLTDTDIGKTKFVVEALRLLTPKILDRGLLHHVMAREFYRHKDFINTHYHYLHCANLENAEEIAKLLVEYHCESANKGEIDLFIAQFIFQFLCIQNPSDPFKSVNQKVTIPNQFIMRRPRGTIKAIAEKIFKSYTTEHPQLVQSNKPFSSPLLNFTYFIISILDSDHDSATFKTLCDVYKTTWRDPNYQSFLNRIGTMYFGIGDQTKQQQSGGFFNNILMSLLDNTDDDEEEEPGSNSNTMSPCEELD